MPKSEDDVVNEGARIRILMVEDEPAICEFLRIGLQYEGYLVKVVYDGRAALDAVSRKQCDLIVLDIMLPDLDGFEVCRKLRLKGFDLPILMLTAKKDVSDRVKGLDLGADDYLTKPFSFEELVARIRALLRRSGRHEEDFLLRRADIVMNTETRQVKRGDKSLHLTPTEFALLELLIRHPGRVFTRETLLNRVWGYDYVGDTNIVDVHVSHLRGKLGDHPPRLIRTHYGVGYSFNPEEPT